MGCTIYYLVLIINPMGRILVRWNFFRNNLGMLWHTICNWLYVSFVGLYVSFVGLYVSFVGLYVSFVGLYVSFVGL